MESYAISMEMYPTSMVVIFLSWKMVEASMEEVGGDRWASGGSCVGIVLFALIVGGSRVPTGIRSGWGKALERWK